MYQIKKKCHPNLEEIIAVRALFLSKTPGVIFILFLAALSFHRLLIHNSPCKNKNDQD